MWERRSLQYAILGPPAGGVPNSASALGCPGGDARQIIFGAAHIDKRQLELCARAPEMPARETKTEDRKAKRPIRRTALRFIRFSYFLFR
jgi:hypothetical protein